MRLFIVLMIILSLWVCTAPLSHPETLKLVNEAKLSEAEIAFKEIQPI